MIRAPKEATCPRTVVSTGQKAERHKVMPLEELNSSNPDTSDCYR